MGVPVRLLLHASGEPLARAAAVAAFARIAALDAILSDYRPDSELRRLGRGTEDWTPVSPELFAVLSRAREVARLTGGAFDPTVGPLVRLWRTARAERRLPAPDAIARARARVGWSGLELDPRSRAVRLARPDIQIDLGGIAKGFVTQAALDTLAQHGIASALVEAGGDLAVSAAPPGRPGWTIDAPGAEPAFAARAAQLVDAALATSGPSAQAVVIDGTRYSHVIDPRSGAALTASIVARVIARDGMTADALATTLTVVSEAERPILLGRFPVVAATVHAEPQAVLEAAAVSRRTP
jgi:thiamine biosynthesis lipoprotein